jgi:hypothetical protein
MTITPPTDISGIEVLSYLAQAYMPESLPHHSAKNRERLDQILAIRNACLQGGVKKKAG